MPASAEMRVRELEAELKLLKERTTSALETSWKEVERLQNEREEDKRESERSGGASSDDDLDFSLRGGENEPHDAYSPFGRTKRRPTLSNFLSGGSPRREAHSPTNEHHPDDVSWAASSFSASLASFGVGSWQKAHTQVEKDLMRQLEVLQADKKHCMEELELKLRQREAAIETLEKALVVKEQDLQRLRDRLEGDPGESGFSRSDEGGYSAGDFTEAIREERRRERREHRRGKYEDYRSHHREDSTKEDKRRGDDRQKGLSERRRDYYEKRQRQQQQKYDQQTRNKTEETDTRDKSKSPMSRRQLSPRSPRRTRSSRGSSLVPSPDAHSPRTSTRRLSSKRRVP